MQKYKILTKRAFLVLLLLVLAIKTYPQSSVDSLQIILNKKIASKSADTVIAKVYIELYKATCQTQPVTAVQHAANAMQIYTSIKDSFGIAITHRYIGDSYFQRGIYNFAMDSYNKSFDIFSAIKNQEQTAYAHIKIGQTYLAQKLDNLSFQSFTTALTIFREIKSEKGISYAYDNIAKIRMQNYNFPECYSYLDSSLQIRIKLKDDKLIAQSYENMANAHIYEEDYESAEKYYKQALKKYIKVNNRNKIGQIYFGLGEKYLFEEMYDQARQNFLEAHKIFSQINLPEKIAETEINLGTIELEFNNIKQAENYAKNALLTSLINDFKEIRLKSYKLLTAINKKQNKINIALDYMQHYEELRDTIIIENQNRQSAELQVNLETQKKEQEIQILEKNKEIQNAEIEKNRAEQKLLIIGLSTLAIIMLVLAVVGLFLIRTNKKVKKANKLLTDKNEEINKQKEEIQYQKNEIEEKNNKINSSLTYAGRMQRAMLPKIAEIRKKLPESFVMLSPKEAVSGDFFWHAVTTDLQGNEKIIITAVDCTGHGVPGAFMSMLADAYLNQIVHQEKIISPDEILHKLHDGIYHSLQQEKTLNTDGMDIAICVIDQKNKILEYSGAKNPLFYMQNNQQYLIKGDTISIGGYVKKDRYYTKEKIDISIPTTFYIYSDGFQDQFGDAENKKYMAKRFRDFLFKIHYLPMNEQAVALATELDDWKGKKEQMDDIIVIGVKL